jgi:hypothetical protein
VFRDGPVLNPKGYQDTQNTYRDNKPDHIMKPIRCRICKPFTHGCRQLLKFCSLTCTTQIVWKANLLSKLRKAKVLTHLKERYDESNPKRSTDPLNHIEKGVSTRNLTYANFPNIKRLVSESVFGK